MKKITNILISQPKPQTERNPYTDMEAHFGVHCDFQQLIRVESLTAREFRDQHIHLEDYTAVLLKSCKAADYFFNLCKELRFQVPEKMHYYCISETVGNYLQKYIQYRKRRVFAAVGNKFETLLPAMNRRPSEKYLMVMSEVHNDEDIQMFAHHKINITPAVMYRTVPSEWPEDKEFKYDMVVLFTPVGVASLHQNFPDWKQGDTVLACFGTNTLTAAEELGYRIDIKAPTPGCPSITAAINEYLEKSNA